MHKSLTIINLKKKSCKIKKYTLWTSNCQVLSNKGQIHDYMFGCFFYAFCNILPLNFEILLFHECFVLVSYETEMFSPFQWNKRQFCSLLYPPVSIGYSPSNQTRLINAFISVVILLPDNLETIVDYRGLILSFLSWQTSIWSPKRMINLIFCC